MKKKQPSISKCINGCFFFLFSFLGRTFMSVPSRGESWSFKRTRTTYGTAEAPRVVAPEQVGSTPAVEKKTTRQKPGKNELSFFVAGDSRNRRGFGSPLIDDPVNKRESGERWAAIRRGASTLS